MASDTNAKRVEQQGSSELPTTETVQLHVLCANCAAFCQRWEVFDWNYDRATSRAPTWPYSFYLCTVTHLRQSHVHCHLCQLLVAALDRWPFASREDILHAKVYLHPRDSGEDTLIVYALFSHEMPTNEETGRHFASFALEAFYHGTFLSIFKPTKLMSSR
jgi:hypothetical protein